MSETIKLDCFINKDKVGYFVLKNNSMDASLFSSMVKSFVNASESKELYGKASKTFETIYYEGELALSMIQRKVPNIIKYLVDDNNINIEITLTGINLNRELETRTIKKPLDINIVLGLVPHYHPSISKAPAKTTSRKQ